LDLILLPKSFVLPISARGILTEGFGLIEVKEDVALKSLGMSSRSIVGRRDQMDYVSQIT
jgi:hypothetical protein